MLPEQYPHLKSMISQFLTRHVSDRIHWSTLVQALLVAHEEGHTFVDCLDSLNGDDWADLATGLAPDSTPLSPLVLQDGKLYFRRYFDLEHQIAMRLLARARHTPREEVRTSHEDLQTLADELPTEHLQALDAMIGAPTTLVTGGPGTGKTTLIRYAVALIQRNEPRAMIRLAAPTGKAAARLRQALANPAAPIDPTVITIETIHQLLQLSRLRGQRLAGTEPYLGATHLFIDEASMLDLALFAQLLNAVPLSCKLILLGDPDQLPAIEVGAILPALLEAAHQSVDQSAPPLDAIRLTKTFRFEDGGRIASLAKAVISGSLDWSEANHQDIVQLLTIESTAAVQMFFGHYVDQLKRETAADPASLIQTFESKRILTPYQEGAFGVGMINQLVEALLESEGLKRRGESHYHGQPILITENDHQQRLANGDLGICIDMQRVHLEDNPYTERFQVAFRERGALRYLPITLLPKFETSFGMSIHKSQGSEFGTVLLLLPKRDSEQAGQILSRQLVYTAMTRAKAELSIMADREVWQNAVTSTVLRRSTLAERIKEAFSTEAGQTS